MKCWSISSITLRLFHAPACAIEAPQQRSKPIILMERNETEIDE